MYEERTRVLTYLHFLVFRFIDKVVYEVTKVIETPQKTQRNPDQYFCQHDF